MGQALEPALPDEPDSPEVAREDRPDEEPDAVPDTPNTDPTQDQAHIDAQDAQDDEDRAREVANVERDAGPAANAIREDNDQEQVYTDAERERLRLNGQI